MKQLKILIVGASGQLGRALLKQLHLFSSVVGTYYSSANKNSLAPTNTDLLQLDIRNQDQINTVVLEIKPDLIINTAAMTNVDACENFPDLAQSINVKGHHYLAEAAQKIRAKLVFISTYYVFDGTKGYYAENDLPGPLNTYARTKVAGEQITLKSAGSLLIRTSKIYSLGYDERNFLARLVAQFQGRETISITNDQYTNPISTEDAAVAIARLIAKESSGIYHLGGPDYLNNYEFALTVAQRCGFDAELLHPLSTEQSRAAALRPKRCALDIHKLIKQTGFEPRSIDANLILWRTLWKM